MSIEITKRIRQKGNNVFIDLEITEESIDKAAKDIEEELFKRIATKKGYVQERTCTMKRMAPPKILECWLTCSNCGPCYPPSADAIQESVKYCPFCGAKVVSE